MRVAVAPLSVMADADARAISVEQALAQRYTAAELAAAQELLTRGAQALDEIRDNLP